jgi:hypothetical protein
LALSMFWVMTLVIAWGPIMTIVVVKVKLHCQVSYMVEAVRLFDHYHFRVAQQEAKKAKKKLQLARPPRKPNESPWWAEDFKDPRKIRDREVFA